MKYLPVFGLLIWILAVSPDAAAQKEVVADGVKYVEHTVTKSETVFSICQKYKVSQKELMQANPGLTAILQAGSVVRIPVGKVTVSEPAKIENHTPVTQTAGQPAEEIYYHKVGKKQTIFTIAKQYGITANDLIRFNPELSNGLEVGQVLKIPANASGQVAAVESATAVADSQEDMSGFTIHPVVSGETLYSLEQKYGVTHEEMLRLNPTLQNGLKAGMKLKIPVKKPAEMVAALNNTAFKRYQVEKGETLFSLAARFGVEVSDLKKANPSLLSRSLESGEIILIPERTEPSAGPQTLAKTATDAVAETTDDTNCRPVQGRNLQKYKVGLLLPFNLSAIDKSGHSGTNQSMLLSKVTLNTQIVSTTDTTAVVGSANIDAKTEGFLEFYEGALLAADSLHRVGMNVELLVFDAGNLTTINSLLQLEEFRDLNLIVGPVYPELQEPVAAFAAKNRIPMISPLAATGNFERGNSWYFKVNPEKEYQIDQTGSYVAGEFSGKNVVMLQYSGGENSWEARVAELSRKKLSEGPGKKGFHEYSFLKQGVNNLKPLLDESGENIFLIPTDNEAQVSVAVTNLNALAETYNIVLMGTPNFIKLKSIQTENYHKIRLRYLSPYFIDYNKPLVKRFIGLYRETFSAEPTQFSFQGFDVTYYFLSALQRFGKDFRNCLPDYPMELTQNAFRFRKLSPMSGQMNEGMFVTSYERNFDVLNYGIVGGF